MRILVVGGGGYLGSRTVEAMRRIRDAQVTAGTRASPDGRSAWARIDLNEPSTFSEMQRHDVVVNASDTLAAPPLQAIDYALYHGVRFVEAGAHAGTMETLLRRTRGPAADPAGWTGTVVLGMGLFPGLSNLLAKQLIAWGGKADRMNVVIRLNPLGGGGPGLVELMVRALLDEAVYYEGGKRMVAPPIRKGVPLYTGRGHAFTLGTGLPEAHMLHASLGIPSVATYLTTVPQLPGWLAGPLMRWMPTGAAAEGLFESLMRRYFRTIRTVLFRKKAGFVEVNTVTGAGDQLAIRTDDGIGATAYALAAGVAVLATSDPSPGAYLPDELFDLGPIMNGLLDLARGDFRLTLHSAMGAARE